MDETTRDLIMALAAGELDEQSAADAMAQIDADPELAAELALQTEALAALSDLEPPMMNDIEMATLRRNLRSELEIAAPVTAAARNATTGTKKRSINWTPIFSIAAVLLVAVFGVTQLANFGGGDSGSDGVAMNETTAPASADAQESAEAPTAALEASPDATFNRATDEAMGDADNTGADTAEEDLADSETPSTEAPSTEAPAAETVPPTTAGPDSGGSTDLPPPNQRVEMVLETAIAALAAENNDIAGARDLLAADPELAYRDWEADNPDCFDESSDAFERTEIPEIIGIVSLGDEIGDGLLIAHFDVDENLLGVIAHDPITCEGLGALP